MSQTVGFDTLDDFAQIPEVDAKAGGCEEDEVLE